MLRKWRKVTLLLSAAMVVLYSVTTLTEIAVIGTQIPRSCCSQFTISASCLVGVAMFVSTYVPFSWCKQMTRRPLPCRECIRNREKECIRNRKKVREPEATFTTRLQLPLCLLAALPCILSTWSAVTMAWCRTYCVTGVHRSPLPAVLELDHQQLCPKLTQQLLQSSSDHAASTESHVIITGHLSFLAARLATEVVTLPLVSSVTLLVDSDNVRDDTMTWYYIQQLTSSRVTLQWVNMSNVTDVQQHLVDKDSKFVMYVTSDEAEVGSVGYNGRQTQQLLEMVTLLEAVSKGNHGSSQFTVVTHGNMEEAATSQSQHTHRRERSVYSSAGSLGNVWRHTVWMTVSMYHRLHGIPTNYVHVGGLYGPWGGEPPSSDANSCWWYISDAVRIIKSHLLASNRSCQILDLSHCPRSKTHSAYCKATLTWNEEGQGTTSSQITTACTPFSEGMQNSLAWWRAHIKEGEVPGDYIFTTYFTTMADPQRKRGRNPNQFQYMRNWYQSVNHLGLRAVVFHDNLSPQFVQKLTNENVSFVKVSSLHNRSTNDARFYVYLSYLQTHPEVRRLFLTDVSDVVFQRDPFELVDLLGDWLYVGTDINFFPDLQSMPWMTSRLTQCFGRWSVEHGPVRRVLQLKTVFNAGVIGGSRSKMLAALLRITQTLDHTPHEHNCNMPAVNYAMHHYFNDVIFTGFPLTSHFLQHQVNPKGVYIIHK